MISPGPCTPRTSRISISAVRLGPVARTIELESAAGCGTREKSASRLSSILARSITAMWRGGSREIRRGSVRNTRVPVLAMAKSAEVTPISASAQAPREYCDSIPQALTSGADGCDDALSGKKGFENGARFGEICRFVDLASEFGQRLREYGRCVRVRWIRVEPDGRRRFFHRSPSAARMRDQHLIAWGHLRRFHSSRKLRAGSSGRSRSLSQAFRGPAEGSLRIFRTQRNCS